MIDRLYERIELNFDFNDHKHDEKNNQPLIAVRRSRRNVGEFIFQSGSL